MFWLCSLGSQLENRPIEPGSLDSCTPPHLLANVLNKPGVNSQLIPIPGQLIFTDFSRLWDWVAQDSAGEASHFQSLSMVRLILCMAYRYGFVLFMHK